MLKYKQHFKPNVVLGPILIFWFLDWRLPLGLQHILEHRTRRQRLCPCKKVWWSLHQEKEGSRKIFGTRLFWFATLGSFPSIHFGIPKIVFQFVMVQEKHIYYIHILYVAIIFSFRSIKTAFLLILPLIFVLWLNKIVLQ